MILHNFPKARKKWVSRKVILYLPYLLTVIRDHSNTGALAEGAPDDYYSSLTTNSVATSICNHAWLMRLTTMGQDVSSCHKHIWISLWLTWWLHHRGRPGTPHTHRPCCWVFLHKFPAHYDTIRTAIRVHVHYDIISTATYMYMYIVHVYYV